MKFTYRVVGGDRYFKKSYDSLDGRMTRDPDKALKWKTRSAAERFAKTRREWQHPALADSIKVVCEITKEQP